MAWTTPRTWVTGETVTAAYLNTHVRDNTNFLAKPPACRLYQDTGNQALSSGVDTVVALSKTYLDNDTMAATSKINIKTTGLYTVSYFFSVLVASGTPTGINGQAWVRLNGTTLWAMSNPGFTAFTVAGGFGATDLIPCTANDYLELMVNLAWTSGSMSVAASGAATLYTPRFAAVRNGYNALP